MSTTIASKIAVLPAMRVASYCTFTETPRQAFAALRRWAGRQGLPSGWAPRFFGFPNPDPFGPGFEAWMSIPARVAVDDDRVRARDFPPGLRYAVLPPGWEGRPEEWMAENTPGYGVHQGFQEYVFAGEAADPEQAETRVYAPVADAPLPDGLEVVELPATRFAAVSLPDLDAFLQWFHAFIGRHAPEQRAGIRLFQAPGESYDAWIDPESTPLAGEGATPLGFPGGRYARVATADLMLPGHIGKGWELAQAAGHAYDGARRFLLEPRRQRNEIASKALIYLYYPIA